MATYEHTMTADIIFLFDVDNTSSTTIACRPTLKSTWSRHMGPTRATGTGKYLKMCGANWDMSIIWGRWNNSLLELSFAEQTKDTHPHISDERDDYYNQARQCDCVAGFRTLTKRVPANDTDHADNGQDSQRQDAIEQVKEDAASDENKKTHITSPKSRANPNEHHAPHYGVASWGVRQARSIGFGERRESGRRRPSLTPHGRAAGR
jgi:hypothetical protein